MLLGRSGFAIAPERLDADATLPARTHAPVQAAWLALYQGPARHRALYELAKSWSTRRRQFASGACAM
jgi:tryptophan 2,3-dioxygenase